MELSNKKIAEINEGIARQLGWVGAKYFSDVGGEYPYDVGVFPEDGKFNKRKNKPVKRGTYPFFAINDDGHLSVFHLINDQGIAVSIDFVREPGQLFELVPSLPFNPVQFLQGFNVLDGKGNVNKKRYWRKK